MYTECSLTTRESHIEEKWNEKYGKHRTIAVMIVIKLIHPKSILRWVSKTKVKIGGIRVEHKRDTGIWDL